jgi:hypothetical protein
MVAEVHPGVHAARTAPLEAIPTLLASTNKEVLDALVENPCLDETHVLLLLERKDLPGMLLEEIAKRKPWRASYRVRRALAAHPHSPRLLSMRLLRELHLMDLVRISLQPASSGELRRLAEERVLAQLPQLPLGQKLMLARRGSSRIVGGLIEQGPEQVVRVALESPYLSEAQLLKTLAREALPGHTVAIIARHTKWSKPVNVRMALVRHPHAPAECVVAFVPDLPQGHIEELLGLARLPGGVRDRLRQEISRRGKE